LAGQAERLARKAHTNAHNRPGERPVKIASAGLEGTAAIRAVAQRRSQFIRDAIPN